MRRTWPITLFITMLLGAGVSSQASGESWQCSRITAPIEIGLEPSELVGTWSHVSDRTLFVLAVCPDQFYEFIDESSIATAQVWLDRLSESFPSLGDSEKRVRISFLETTIERLRTHQTKVEHLELQELILSRLEIILSTTAVFGNEKVKNEESGLRREDGLGLTGASKRTFVSTNESKETVCGSFTEIVLQCLVEDWTQRDGAWFIVFSEYFLFMLAFCPEEVYSVMDVNPLELSTWLEELPYASFSGFEDYEVAAEGKRRNLLEFLESAESGQFPMVRSQILDRLREIRYNTVE